MKKPPGAERKKRSVLFAHDTGDQRDMYARQFRWAGLRVRAVANGARAFAEARRTAPDVIVLGYRLRSIDGPTLCWLLKHDPRTRRIPLILLTADVFEAHVINARGVGCDLVLTSPCPPDRLSEAAVALVGRSAALTRATRRLADRTARASLRGHAPGSRAARRRHRR